MLLDRLPRNLRKQRDGWGFTRREVYLNTFIAEKSLYQYERGLRTPPVHALYRLAKFYQTTIEALIEE